MRTTRRQRCGRNRSRRVSIRRSNRARRSAPSLSSGIQVHSSSPLPCRQNLPPHHARHRPHAKLGSGATNACAAAAKSAASQPRDTPPGEIPPYPAANSSARDSPPAAAPLRLRAEQRIGLALSVEGNLSFDAAYFASLSGEALEEENRL